MHPEIVQDQPVADVLGIGRPAIASIGEWWLNANRPPGRSRRAASGTVRYGSAKVIAPWSQKTMSNYASGSGTASALAWTSGKSTPASAISRRACSSWRAEKSRPTMPGAAFRERDRPLGGAAAELEHVLAGDVAEDLQLRLGILGRPPGRPAAVGEVPAVPRLVLVAIGVSRISRLRAACPVRARSVRASRSSCAAL